MSQQPHKDEGWLRMSECDGARQKKDLLSGIRVIFLTIFYFCCLPCCFLCYLQGFGCGAENEVKDLVKYGKVKARIA